MRVARVWHGKDGYTLAVVQVPAWALALSWIADHACAVTGHVICHPREWMFKLGWSKDEDGHAEHSLGGFLYDLSNKPFRLEHHHTTEEYQRPLTVAEVAEHFPDARIEFLEDDWVDDGSLPAEETMRRFEGLEDSTRG